jgi:hypothetical protein
MPVPTMGCKAARLLENCRFDNALAPRCRWARLHFPQIPHAQFQASFPSRDLT